LLQRRLLLRYQQPALLLLSYINHLPIVTKNPVHIKQKMPFPISIIIVYTRNETISGLPICRKQPND